MSIFRQTASMILKEHKHRRITGDVLLIGRQTVLLTVDEALELVASEGLERRTSFVEEMDASTIGSNAAQYITDRSFFSMFSDARVIALDVSDYEGAEIVHDLNAPLPKKYEKVADFIFNGSCLDNLFDPATAMKSISKMLRPHGRVLHLEHGSPVQGAFLCYSPEWFFDFYAINNYSDCQNFVCTFGSSLQNDWEIFRWQPYYVDGAQLKQSSSSLFIGDFINFVIAEKGDASTDDQTPIQSQYRGFQGDRSEAVYVEKYHRYSRSGRNFSFTAESPQPAAQAPLAPSPSPLPPPTGVRRAGVKGFVLHVVSYFGITIRRGGPFVYRIERLARSDAGMVCPQAAPTRAASTYLGGTAGVNSAAFWNKPELRRLGVLLRQA